MDTLSVFAMGAANRSKELRVFDWEQAARRIREVAPTKAAAGLAEDWFFTGGTIFENGESCFSDYCYLASTWATPVLELDGKSEPCFRMQSQVPEWGAGTRWPESARKILKGE